MCWASAHLQSVFIFLFLGNEYRRFSLSIQREEDKWNADIALLQLKPVRCSQWTPAWYEDLIKVKRYDRFIGE